MTDRDKIRFFHAPNACSSAVLLVARRTRATYELHVLNRKAGKQREAALLAVNPMDKAPAILYGELAGRGAGQGCYAGRKVDQLADLKASGEG